MTPTTKLAPPTAADSFIPRHIGPSAAATAEMLATVGYDSLDAFIDAVIPPNIRLRRPLAIHGEMSERDALASMRRMADRNRLFRSYIGMGYSGTITPPVIQRNILENPGWYTAYTPYQAEDGAGASGGAAELPDDDHRSHRAGDRQRVAARRGHGGGGGDDDGQRHQGRRRQAPLLRVGRLPSADDRRGEDAGRRARGSR